MKRIVFLIACTILLMGCGPNSAEKQQQLQSKTYECEHFSLSYPEGYYLEEEPAAEDDFHTLMIGKDSLDDNMTTIQWESPNTFPGTVKDFVTVFVYQEINDYEQSNTFYDVMLEDSTYKIDGHPTHSITSVFTEGEDTIIQSRIGLIIPQKCDMMIVQRVNSKKSQDDVEIMGDIVKSIRFKE